MGLLSVNRRLQVLQLRLDSAVVVIIQIVERLLLLHTNCGCNDYSNTFCVVCDHSV